MFGIFQKSWQFFRKLANIPIISTLLKFVMVPFLIQFVLMFFMVAYKIAYGTEQKIVDLTWEFDEKTIYWPGFQKFNYTKKIGTSESGYWYAGNEFQAAEHGGTHLDAPYHFIKDGWKVADIPINRFFANAIMVDFSSEVEAHGSDYIVDAKLLESKLKSFEPIQNNTVLLIKYGWSKYWPDKKQYMRLDDEQVGHYPGLDNSSATVIANDDRFIGIAVDTSSADAGISENYAAHRILLGRNMYILENTKMVEHFPEKMFTLVVAPMKLTEGSGAPVRIFAVLT
ncbi:kynurenine formamidase-like [Coccinella septempunctata]|uniref:kynurenine formamidase-like n=1 Tax=Coccinella septempunctata TaxID=41139 RepID=UPI001D0696CB|nr:kynurenine formamidase-like [Coccinella septempunctata]